MSGIFDSHAHYDDISFDSDRGDLLSSLPKKGVSYVINCGTNVISSKKSADLSEKYDYIYMAAGIHPEDAKDIDDGDFKEIEELFSLKKCVAVGEIGLDYHYGVASKEKQSDVFERQLYLSVKRGLPVIVHDREAHSDTLSLLKKYKPSGVLHCFSGSVEMAKEVLNLGLYLGFGGALTFKNAKKPVEVASFAPLDRILLETDCPYMSPEPLRGGRNDSSNIIYIAEKLSEIKSVPVEEILNITEDNAKRLFRIQ